MFEKNLELGYLLDFYGELLSERKRAVMDMYYNEDLSLAEIASEIGISRQGARDIIKKSEDELLFFEEKLGLAKKLQSVSRQASELKALSSELSLSKDFEKKLDELISTVEK
ncbi:MAG: DNA-binding protein [Clostridia bacterium]|nr:DNA-binding protein [Clostridia bacterium]